MTGWLIVAVVILAVGALWVWIAVGRMLLAPVQPDERGWTCEDEDGS